MKRHLFSLSCVVILATLLFGCGGGSSGSGSSGSDRSTSGNGTLPTSNTPLGLLWSEETWAEVPAALPPVSLFVGASALPVRADLSGSFPPVGNQERGTCVAWAAGYYLKSYLEARDRNWEPTIPERQFSPKFLYEAVDRRFKNGCDGMFMDAAMDVLVETGITTLRTVPYSNLSPLCDVDRNQMPPQWLTEADRFRIANYRRVDNISKDSIKAFIAQGSPVVFGARLGDGFVNWRGGGVLERDNFSYLGRDAYHAMVVVGYDDTMGTRGAFRIVNSWGERWGDAGFIWVGYDHFVAFTFLAFVAENRLSDDVTDPAPVPRSERADLVAKSVATWPEPWGYRLGYRVENNGGRDVSYTDDWAVVFLYFNAFNQNDFGILASDVFSSRYSEGTYVGALQGFNYHYDLPIGDFFQRDYNNYLAFSLPSWLFGQYYFVLIADPFWSIEEDNRDNNIAFLNYAPVFVSNGRAQIFSLQQNSDAMVLMEKETQENTQAGLLSDGVAGQAFEGSITGRFQERLEDPNGANAYSRAEISMLLKHYREIGLLGEMVSAFSADGRAVTRTMAPPEMGRR